MKSHRIGFRMKSHRILGPAYEIAQNLANVISQRVANEIAQNPANAISQGVANGGSPDPANETTQNPANGIPQDLANEIAQDPADAISPALQMKSHGIGCPVVDGGPSARSGSS